MDSNDAINNLQGCVTSSSGSDCTFDTETGAVTISSGGSQVYSGIISEDEDGEIVVEEEEEVTPIADSITVSGFGYLSANGVYTKNQTLGSGHPGYIRNSGSYNYFVYYNPYGLNPSWVISRLRTYGSNPSSEPFYISYEDTLNPIDVTGWENAAYGSYPMGSIIAN